nr:MAG: protein of unknown function DUF2591 [Bacteriophage sp.]
MSTDYSKMSDTEIAQKVFFWLSNDFCPNGGLAHINNDGFFFFDNGNVKRKFDPCNNPVDAWPIIVDNKISIHHFVCKYEASSIVFDKKYKDGFFIFSQHSDVGDISSRAALRAAMITFLKMQESKNAS